jgi:hypothetical protein
MREFRVMLPPAEAAKQRAIDAYRAQVRARLEVEEVERRERARAAPADCGSPA